MSKQFFKIGFFFAIFSLLSIFPGVSMAYTHTDHLYCDPNGAIPSNASPCDPTCIIRDYECDQSVTVACASPSNCCPGIDWSCPSYSLVASCTPLVGEYYCNPGYNLDGGQCLPPPQCDSTGTYCEPPPANARCINGTPTDTVSWTWNCVSLGGGFTVPCNAIEIPTIYGECGLYDGQVFVSEPTGSDSAFCTAGVFSGVSGSGPWSWTCAGTCEGGSATCSSSMKDAWKEIAP